MEKIKSIIEAIAHDKNISYTSAKEAFKQAIINTAKRLEGRDAFFEVVEDEDNDRFNVYRVFRVTDDEELLEEHPQRYISLDEAKEFGDVEVGDEIRMEFNLEDYGTTGASHLYRELEYHLQRKVESDLFESYKKKVGSIIFGIVTRVDEDENTFVEIGELKGILTLRNRIKGERFEKGDTIKALLKYVKVDKKYGMFLELTRTAPKFLEELLKREVPEIEDGVVEIVSSARIPGERAKVALKTDRPNIDPVGAAVGQKGIRINAVSKELNGENIDCIEYSPIPEIYISRALAPAIIKGVKIVEDKNGDKKAVVTITKDQKAKAIGKSGINIRLASMLTKYPIELQEVEGVSIAPTTSESSSSSNEQKTTDTSALESLFK
jgi:N utilization substance protein A